MRLLICSLLFFSPLFLRQADAADLTETPQPKRIVIESNALENDLVRNLTIGSIGENVYFKTCLGSNCQMIGSTLGYNIRQVLETNLKYLKVNRRKEAISHCASLLGGFAGAVIGGASFVAVSSAFGGGSADVAGLLLPIGTTSTLGAVAGGHLANQLFPPVWEEGIGKPILPIGIVNLLVNLEISLSEATKSIGKKLLSELRREQNLISFIDEQDGTFSIDENDPETFKIFYPYLNLNHHIEVLRKFLDSMP